MTEPLPIQPTRPVAPADGLARTGSGDADSAVQELVQGKTENVSEVLTAVEKADLAFRALMQVRNKLIEAYEEINRLRV